MGNEQSQSMAMSPYPQENSMALYPTRSQGMHLSHVSPYPTQMASPSIRGGMAVGGVNRAATVSRYIQAVDTTGRPDLNVLQSTIITRMPEISGYPADQISAVAYGSQGYGQTDIIPMAAQTRYNRFASEDLRGDPITADQAGYTRHASTLAAVRFGGSDEFVQRSLADAVAPVPSLPQAPRPSGPVLRDTNMLNRPVY